MTKIILKYKYILKRENGEIVNTFDHINSAKQFQIEYRRDFREELKIKKMVKQYDTKI